MYSVCCVTGNATDSKRIDEKEPRLKVFDSRRVLQCVLSTLPEVIVLRQVDLPSQRMLLYGSFGDCLDRIETSSQVAARNVDICSVILHACLPSHVPYRITVLLILA